MLFIPKYEYIATLKLGNYLLLHLTDQITLDFLEQTLDYFGLIGFAGERKPYPISRAHFFEDDFPQYRDGISDCLFDI